jgi:HEAT repeat protein
MHLQRLSVLLAKLEAMSPLPSDEELGALPEEGSRRLDDYVELLKAIKQETQAEFPLKTVSVLLLSFGVGDGYGAYWTTVHLIESFPDTSSLYTFIQQASKSPNPGTRKWCCLLLGRRRSIDDLPFLLERLKDEVPAVRLAALSYGISMLAQVYPLPQAIPVVTELLNDEEEAVRKCAQELMTTLRT